MTQDTVVINKAEIFNVEKRYYYETNVLHLEIPLDIKGINHGVEKTFRSNGMPWTETPYNHGIQVNTQKFYDDSGRVYEERRFNENGELCSTTLYMTGKPYTIQHNTVK